MADDEEEASFVGGIKLFQLDQLASPRLVSFAMIHHSIVRIFPRDDVISHFFVVGCLKQNENRWLDHHNAIVQLSLRAVLQTAQLKEETVYSKLLATEKVFLFLYTHILFYYLWQR